jgi:hypothetical protein
VTYYRMEMIHMSQDIILFKTFLNTAEGSRT